MTVLNIFIHTCLEADTSVAVNKKYSITSTFTSDLLSIVMRDIIIIR